jgi:hypothetical protein
VRLPNKRKSARDPIAATQPKRKRKPTTARATTRQQQGTTQATTRAARRRKRPRPATTSPATLPLRVPATLPSGPRPTGPIGAALAPHVYLVDAVGRVFARLDRDAGFPTPRRCRSDATAPMPSGAVPT